MCSGGFFLFRGGCYSTTSTSGGEICTAASGGKCTACKTGNGLFKNPNNAPTLGSECILCSDATGDGTTKGVENCQTCTAPGSAGAATCSACQVGYVKDANANVCKPCGTGCSTCSADNTDQCTACLEGKYLNGNACIDGTGDTCGQGKYADPTTNECKSCATETSISECTACTYSSSLQKPVCSACGGSKPLLKTAADGTTTCETNCGDGYFQHTATSGDLKTCQSCATGTNDAPAVSGIQNCASCTYTSNTLKCTACGEGKKPNKEGTGCFDCGISGCAYCSGTGKCEECASGFTLSEDKTKCASSSANRSGLSTGAIAGISVAAVVVVGGLVGFLCWWFLCRGKAA